MPRPIEPERLAELAARYESSGLGMRVVAVEQGVSHSTISRAVALERATLAAVATPKRQALAEAIVACVTEMLRGLALTQERLRENLADVEWTRAQSGRDLAALLQVQSREARGWHDYAQRLAALNGHVEPPPPVADQPAGPRPIPASHEA